MSEQGAQRPFAVFDIDGTIIRWQLYHSVVNELGKRRLIEDATMQEIRQARMQWKNRRHDTAFPAYQDKLVATFHDALPRIPVADFDHAIQTVFAEHKEQVYTYTRDLIASLKQKNYLLFAISGSFQQIVDEFAAFYGFDGAIGSQYNHDQHAFTGERSIVTHDAKLAHLKKFITTHNATYEGSIAVGDSDGDVAMLSAVEQPIAFNPNQALYDIAKERGWRIVIERKNVIYQLEPRDGSYVLA